MSNHTFFISNIRKSKTLILEPKSYLKVTSKASTQMTTNLEFAKEVLNSFFVSRLLWKIEGAHQLNFDFKLKIRDWFYLSFENEESLNREISEIFKIFETFLNNYYEIVNILKDQRERNETQKFQMHRQKNKKRVFTFITMLEKKGSEETNIFDFLNQEEVKFSIKVFNSLWEIQRKINMLFLKIKFASWTNKNYKKIFDFFNNKVMNRMSDPIVCKIIEENNFAEITKLLFEFTVSEKRPNLFLNTLPFEKIEIFSKVMDKELIEKFNSIKSNIETYGKIKICFKKRFVNKSSQQN